MWRNLGIRCLKFQIFMGLEFMQFTTEVILSLTGYCRIQITPFILGKLLPMKRQLKMLLVRARSFPLG
ncbi:hypothetical protein BK640_26585 [Pseudomonas protegens]|nr:hypothetical protein BK640_26585 [Pseudomonas protegens]